MAIHINSSQLLFYYYLAQVYLYSMLVVSQYLWVLLGVRRLESIKTMTMALSKRESFSTV